MPGEEPGNQGPALPARGSESSQYGTHRGPTTLPHTWEMLQMLWAAPKMQTAGKHGATGLTNAQAKAGCSTQSFGHSTARDGAAACWQVTPPGLFCGLISGFSQFPIARTAGAG